MIYDPNIHIDIHIDPPTLHFRHSAILIYLKGARIQLPIDHFLQA